VGWFYTTFKLPPLPFWKLLHFQLPLLASISHLSEKICLFSPASALLSALGFALGLFLSSPSLFC
jgi:hypothetical protein